MAVTSDDGDGGSVFARARSSAARHPHTALLVAVAATLVSEPAVQAGREAGSNAEYAGAAVGLAARAAIALACLLVAWEGQRRLRLVPVLACSALLGLGWLALHRLTGVDPDQDLGFYAEDGTQLLEGMYPRSEYPTGAVGLFALETLLGGDPPRELHGLVMLGCHLVVVTAIWSLRTPWSAWLATFVAIWPLNLFHWEFRYDNAPAAFFAVGIALAVATKWGWSGSSLGIGAALKWSPALAVVPLVGWLVAHRQSRSASRLAAGFLVSLGVLTLPFLLWSPSSVLAAYEFQGDRGVTGESLWYLPFSIVGLASAGANPSDDAGTSDLLDAGVTLVQVALLVALVVIAVRARTRERAIALAALCPAVFLLTNRVFSSQFLVLLVVAWALAAALLVVSARDQLVVGLGTATATFANALVHPYTVPFAWELASAAMFAVAGGLTAWLFAQATLRPAEAAPG
jgi:hypothetical protein